MIKNSIILQVLILLIVWILPRETPHGIVSNEFVMGFLFGSSAFIWIMLIILKISQSIEREKK